MNETEVKSVNYREMSPQAKPKTIDAFARQISESNKTDVEVYSSRGNNLVSVILFGKAKE